MYILYLSEAIWFLLFEPFGAAVYHFCWDSQKYKIHTYLCMDV